MEKFILGAVAGGFVLGFLLALIGVHGAAAFVIGAVVGGIAGVLFPEK